MADSIGTVNNQSSTQPNGHNSHSNTRGASFESERETGSGASLEVSAKS